MKTVLIILGIILLAGAAYGFITVGDSALPAEVTDAVVDAGNALGLTGNLSFTDQVKVFLVDNRIILAVVGAVSLLVGLILPRDPRRSRA